LGGGWRPRAQWRGTTDLNRAKWPSLKDNRIAWARGNEAVGDALAEEAASFTRQVQWILPVLLFSTLIASFAAGAPGQKFE